MKHLTINNLLSLTIIIILIFFGITAARFVNDSKLPDFDFELPVEVVSEEVPIGGYLDIVARRCRYTTQPSSIIRTLNYPDGLKIAISTDEDPDIKTYEPNCLDKDGNRLTREEAEDRNKIIEVPAQVYIPHIIKGEVSDEPVLSGCGVTLTSLIITKGNIFSSNKEYSYTTEDFCFSRNCVPKTYYKA